MNDSKTTLCTPFLELFTTLSLGSLIPQFRFTIMLSKLWTHIKEMRHAHYMALRDFKIVNKCSTFIKEGEPREIIVKKENLWRTQQSSLKYSPVFSQSKNQTREPARIYFEYSWYFSPFLLSFVKTILWILAFGGIVIGVYWLRVHYSGDEKRITEVTVPKQRIDNSQGDFLQGETTIRKTTTQCGQ
jgi:hypothetical protein